MALIEEFQATGNWLFRRRSYLPVFLLVFVAVSMFFAYKSQNGPTIPWILFCLFVSMVGETMRIYVVGHAPDNTSGRNTTKQVADVINMTGAYSLIRHPLYFANYLMWLGLSLFTGIWWITVIFSLCYWIYYERIMMAEENFLRGKFGDAYLEYSYNVPAFLPLKWHNWQAPNTPFRWKKVLKRELSSFYAVVVNFAVLAFYQDYLITSKLSVNKGWLLFFAFGTLIYLILRFLKKQTKVLHY